MIIIDFIKDKYQQRQLGRMERRQRIKRIDNWNDIKSIGLIFTVGDSGLWSLIQRFITSQERQGKEIHIIGFQASDYEVDYIFSHTGTTICHEKEDFTKLGLPKEGVIDPFIEKHYDLVIDATADHSFFGRYITALSDSNLRVGPTYDDEEVDNLYDLTIGVGEEMDFRDYIEQIVKYLSMVKK